MSSSDRLYVSWLDFASNGRSSFRLADWTEDGRLVNVDPYLIWRDIAYADNIESQGNSQEDSGGTANWVAVLVELEAPWLSPHAFGDWLIRLDQIDGRGKGVLCIPTNLDRYFDCAIIPMLVDRYALRHLLGDSGRRNFNVVRLEYCEAANVAANLSGGVEFFNNLIQSLVQSRAERGIPSILLPLRGFFRKSSFQPSLRRFSEVPSSASEVFDRGGPYRNYGHLNSIRREPASVTPKPLVLVVDDHCHFASPSLLRDGVSVAMCVWHQGDDPKVYERLDKVKPSGSLWTLPFSEPSRMTAGDDSFKVQGSLLGRRLDLLDPAVFNWLCTREEAGAYADSAYMATRRHWSHGSAVTEIIANASGRKGSASAKLPANSLMFCQLPTPTVADTAGGSLSCVVLDSIRDGLEVAKYSGDRPLIVNVSYGTYSGPHDGTSMFERALEDLLHRNEKLHVVLPAGNSHLSRTHCAGWVQPFQTIEFQWKVQPDNPGESFAQVWLDRAEGVSISLIPPFEVSPSPVRVNGIKVLRAGKRPVAAVIFPPSVAQGKNGTMALLAISRTRQVSQDADPKYIERLRELGASQSQAAPSTPGVWKVRIHNTGKAAVHQSTWIQRGDNAPGRTRAAIGHTGRQGVILDPPQSESLGQRQRLIFAAPDPSGTLNGIATLPITQEFRGRLWVVGASRVCDGGLSVYSSAGPSRFEPSRCEGPDVVVPADESINLPGILTAGMLGRTRIRVGGTSMAAAVLTNALYDALANKKMSGRAFADAMVFSRVASTRPLAAAGSPEPAETFLRGDRRRLEAVELGILSSPQCGDTCGG